MIPEKYLPIGSVVLLKGGDKKLMITSYLIIPSAKIKKIYDYGACTYPEGILESRFAVGFNHEDIEKVFHIGMNDEEYDNFNQVLLTTSDAVKDKFYETINNS